MRPLAALLLAALPAPALAQAAPEAAPRWLAGAAGGVVARDGDAARDYEAAWLAHRFGQAYARLTLTRFESATEQADAVLPSTYRLVSLTGGARFGDWFADGYATLGRQHYRTIQAGQVALAAAAVLPGDSGVAAFGVDGGRVVRLTANWLLTPSAAIQHVASRTLRVDYGPDGLLPYETTEDGFTGSTTLRLDRLFGRDRRHDVGLAVTRYLTSNRSAVLASASLGGATDATRAADGWTEVAGSAALALDRRLVLDLAASRGFGARGGDATVASAGVRLFF